MPQKKGGGGGKWVAALIFLVLIGFCGYTYHTENVALDSLEVEVTGAGTPGLTLTSASIPLTLTYTNNSDYESPPITLSYTAYVGETPIATGTSSVGRIPSHSSENSALTITVSSTQVGMATWNAITTGNFTVTLEGNLEAKLLFGLIPKSQSFTAHYP